MTLYGNAIIFGFIFSIFFMSGWFLRFWISLTRSMVVEKAAMNNDGIKNFQIGNLKLFDEWNHTLLALSLFSVVALLGIVLAINLTVSTYLFLIFALTALLNLFYGRIER